MSDEAKRAVKDRAFDIPGAVSRVDGIDGSSVVLTSMALTVLKAKAGGGVEVNELQLREMMLERR